jgi:hypothetical protein
MQSLYNSTRDAINSLSKEFQANIGELQVIQFNQSTRADDECYFFDPKLIDQMEFFETEYPYRRTLKLDNIEIVDIGGFSLYGDKGVIDACMLTKEPGIRLHLVLLDEIMEINSSNIIEEIKERFQELNSDYTKFELQTSERPEKIEINCIMEAPDSQVIPAYLEKESKTEKRQILDGHCSFSTGTRIKQLPLGYNEPETLEPTIEDRGWDDQKIELKKTWEYDSIKMTADGKNLKIDLVKNSIDKIFWVNKGEVRYMRGSGLPYDSVTLRRDSKQLGEMMNLFINSQNLERQELVETIRSNCTLI